MINPHRADRVILDRSEYESLIRSRDKLQGLEAGGVDNWEWYSESLKDFYLKHYPEDFDD